jgi:hypothetical protein
MNNLDLTVDGDRVTIIPGNTVTTVHLTQKDT